MKKMRFIVWALLCGCAFISCGDITEPDTHGAPPQEGFFGGWIWENPDNPDQRRALNISSETIVRFQSGEGYDGSYSTAVTRWLPENNPHLESGGGGGI
ncbi:MAG: hypothetical protein LBD20_00050 [Spirochaetaceae bacterium]|jgi:hypothetical protein|nr:hypothetical protein [Spirochaetaceae bacterium]